VPPQGGAYNLQSISATLRKRVWFTRLTLYHDYLQTLEKKVAAGGLSAPCAPEPILTCVQYQEEYKESQNVEGYCKYHPSPPQSAGWNYMYVVTI